MNEEERKKMNERKAFQAISEEENNKSSENGMSIYKALRLKYPNKNKKDMDAIMNSMCAALVILIRLHIAEDNRPYIIQVIHKILTESTKS